MRSGNLLPQILPKLPIQDENNQVTAEKHRKTRKSYLAKRLEKRFKLPMLLIQEFIDFNLPFWGLEIEPGPH